MYDTCLSAWDALWWHLKSDRPVLLDLFASVKSKSPLSPSSKSWVAHWFLYYRFGFLKIFSGCMLDLEFELCIWFWFCNSHFTLVSHRWICPQYKWNQWSRSYLVRNLFYGHNDWQLSCTILMIQSLSHAVVARPSSELLGPGLICMNIKISFPIVEGPILFLFTFFVGSEFPLVHMKKDQFIVECSTNILSLWK